MSRTLDKVVADLTCREAAGILEYGTTVDRADLSNTDWLRHAYHEALDLAMYLRRAIDGLEGNTDGGDLVDVGNIGGGHGRGRLDGHGSGFQIRQRATVNTVSRLTQLRAPASVTYLVLCELADDDGVVSIGYRDLAVVANYTTTTAKNCIDDLERVGLVERLEKVGRRTTVRIV